MADNAKLEPKLGGKAVTPRIEEKPDGWWTLALKGTREGVVKAIEKDEKTPAAAKAWLKSVIDGLDASLNHLELHAHFHVVDGKMKGETPGKTQFSLTINPSAMLT